MPAGAQAGAIRGLGAELDWTRAGSTSTAASPCLRAALRADRALVLTGQAQLDLAGRPVPFEELTKYSWGGEAILESRHGDITQPPAASSTCSPATTAPAA